MSYFEFRLMHLANGLVAITGIGYGVIKYFFVVEGAYGPEPHASLGTWQHAHVITAPLLALLLGAFWKAHAQSLLRKNIKEGRRSGLGLLWFVLPMVFSGYLIQIAMTDVWRNIFIWIHVVVSVLWIAAYAIHWLAHVRSRA